MSNDAAKSVGAVGGVQEPQTSFVLPVAASYELGSYVTALESELPEAEFI